MTHSTSPYQRLSSFGPALLFSAVLHALLILSLGVVVSNRSLLQESLSRLEVTLVNRAPNEAPRQADLLAEVNYTGSAPMEQERIPLPVAPDISPEPAPSADVSKFEVPNADQAPERKLPAVATASLDARKGTTAEKPVKRQKNAQTAEANAPLRTPSAAQLISRSLEMANLATSLDRSRTAYDKLIKEKVISASTREHKYAAYMEAWRRKVERIGNLNFPEEARKAGLTGELLLDVTLNADGTVRDITVLRSSGSKVLDQAATRIVHLVAPYAPFPEAIRNETEVLHIVRTWRFERGSRLISGR